MNVSEVMTAQVVTVKPTSTLTEVARVMAQIESGAVPVTDGDKVIGLVTDRDIVIRGIATGVGLDSPVSGVMTSDVQTCAEGDNVADASAKMGSHQIRRLVVLNEQGNLAGILSLGDIAKDYGAKVVGRTLEEISEDTAATQ
ncbi:CBS domain-containing protein [Phenylobacterium sp.]|uniref:CBS domain-containing protein n=1 Tax=Phenylobacterium sp. TaxID=1871053 RepID=UPI002732D358|nr:CBS domain-containing protein [Phenylobacterium sp.]MDP3659684.1 CBS domain-containing protein [Phenylobacterium sp.]